MKLSYNLAYQETILVHSTRRQIFAGKPYSTFYNIWDLLIPEKMKNPSQSSKAPSVERYFVMLGRCNIRGGFEARGPCILSRTYCWILLKSSLLLHVYLLLQCRVYMPHAHGESNGSLLCCTYVLNFKVSALIAAYKDMQRTPFWKNIIRDGGSTAL